VLGITFAASVLECWINGLSLYEQVDAVLDTIGIETRLQARQPRN
jgi:hypothetical protein